MVILGGLELVAAGVILHKYNKGKEQERELEREQNRRSREKRHDRKHHHHRESPPRHIRKDSSLYPPQNQTHRAHSAPPPGYTPNWQPQPTYYPAQSWQPQQHEKTAAWNPQPNNYAPNWQAQLQSQSYGYPQPPQQQPQQPMYPTPHHDDAALSDILQRRPSSLGSQPAARPQPRPNAVAPPDPSYVELSADNQRFHDTKSSASPHVTFAVSEDEPRRDRHTEPPPAYQEPRPEYGT